MTPEEIRELQRLRRIRYDAEDKARSAPPQAPAAPAAVPVSTVAERTPEQKAALFPKMAEETAKGTDLYFQAKSGKVKEQVAAELKSDIASAPDFTTYAKLAKTLSEIERDFKPGEPVDFVGGRPVMSGEMLIAPLPFIGGIREPAPSTIPLNVPSSRKLSALEGIADALRPQILVGPVASQYESTTSVDRAKRLLSDAGFAAYLKDVPKEKIPQVLEEFAGSRAALATVIDKLGPDATDEDIYTQFKTELDDLGPRLQGKSTREAASTVRSEPGQAPNIAAAIYSRATTPGVVPNLTDAQTAYLEATYKAAYPRLSKTAEAELRTALTDADVDVPSPGKSARTAGEDIPATIKRKRTPEEVDRAVKDNLPSKIAELQLPWWQTSQKSEFLNNPEKYAEGGGLFETKYPTGATREGFGGFALRVAMAPINVISTTLGAGAARTGEAAAKLSLSDEEVARTPSAVLRAREARGDKGASLPEGFIGDLTDSVMFNRGGSQVVGDIYKEIGLNENLGMTLGFALDILAPPLGGVASSAVKGRQAFSAARAAQAAGLIGAEGAMVSGGKAFGNAMRDAWTWRSVVGKGGAVVPGSIKLLAAEETGRMLALREEIAQEVMRIGRPLDEAEAMSLVRRWSAENEGGGKIARDFEAAAKKGRFFVESLADDISTGSTSIRPDSYFGGAASIPKAADRIGDALEAAVVSRGVGEDGTKALSDISEPVLKTLMRNAAGRSDLAADILRTSTSEKPAVILTNMYVADPAAVRRAIGTTVAYDAFNQAQKAKGFAEFPDLVLISNRFIGTPDIALAAGEASAKTDIGRLISFISGKEADTVVVAATPEMLALNPQRAVTAVTVKPSEIITIEEAVRGFERAGTLTADNAAYVRSLLSEGQVPVTGLRYLAEANIDSIIAGRGSAVDITNIKAVSGESGVFGVVTEQVLAKKNIFSVTEVRSAFDDILYRATASRGDKKTAMQFLDVPPNTQRAVEDFYAQVGNIDKKIKATYDALRAENPALRQAYGLPATGKVTESQILQAMARGSSEDDTARFVNAATEFLLGGYQDKVTSKLFGAKEWMARSFFSTNSDVYLTPVGMTALDAAKQTAINSIRNNAGDTKQVVEALIREVNGILAQRESTTALYRMDVNKLVLTTSKEVEDAVPKIIGSSIFNRETELLAANVRRTVVADDAVKAVKTLIPEPIRNILGAALRGDIEAAINQVTGRNVLIDADLSGQKLLIAGAIRARDRGYIGSDGMLTGMLESIGITPQEADAVLQQMRSGSTVALAALDRSAPAYFAAAEQSLLRSRLNGDSIEDTLSVIFAQTRGSTSLPRSLVTGRVVDDAINQFMQEETFGKVLEQIYTELPRQGDSAQKVATFIDDALKFIGGVRYNAFLYLRPNYHVGNIVTAPLIIHSTLGIENSPSLPDLYHATRTMQSGAGKAVGSTDNTVAFIDSVGRPFTYGDLRDMGTRSGLFKTEQQVLFSPGSLEEVSKEANKMGSPQPVLDALKTASNWPADWGNSTDNFFRMSSYIKALREGKPITVAQEIGKKSLFDFGTLTDAERAFASRYLIFYTFSRVAAEQLVKTLGNPASLSRVMKQAAVSRDLNAMLYEHAGGKRYDIRRFYMQDSDLARIFWPSEDVGMTQFTSFTPGNPTIDSFMTIAGLLYARDTLEIGFGTETGLARFADPLIKEGLEVVREEKQKDKRAERLRLADARHVGLMTSLGTLGIFTSAFGELTPIEPARDTTITYNGKEWQLSPEGYDLYKQFNTWASTAGLMSTVNYYGQIPEGLDQPGRDRFAKMAGFGAQQRPGPAGQEQSVLKSQAKAVQERTKMREELQGLQIKGEMKQ
jgi:hypothetical protein